MKVFLEMIVRSSRTLRALRPRPWREAMFSSAPDKVIVLQENASATLHGLALRATFLKNAKRETTGKHAVVMANVSTRDL